MALTISVIVCAYNEAGYIGPCLQSLLHQSRRPDEILVVNNASTDQTRGDRRCGVAGVRVIDEPRKGLVRARETGRAAARGQLLVYLDADCRAPRPWLARVERRFERGPALVALSGPYRFYDWDWWGRAAGARVRPDAGAADAAAGLPRCSASARSSTAATSPCVARRWPPSAASTRRSSFTAKTRTSDAAWWRSARSPWRGECWLYTSARRYRAMGKGQVFRLYVRNFWSEIIHHRPKDEQHQDVRI